MCPAAFALITLTSLEQRPIGECRFQRISFPFKAGFWNFPGKCSLFITCTKTMELSRWMSRVVFCLLQEEDKMRNGLCEWMRKENEEKRDGRKIWSKIKKLCQTEESRKEKSKSEKMLQKYYDWWKQSFQFSNAYGIYQIIIATSTNLLKCLHINTIIKILRFIAIISLSACYTHV